MAREDAHALDTYPERVLRLSRRARSLFLAAAVVILTALAFERFGGYAPCPLCLQQRYAYYAGVPALFLALVLLSAGYARLAAAVFLLVAAAFLANAGLGTYHAGAEWKFWPGPDTCAGAPQPLSTGGGLLKDLATTRVIRCDEAPWHFLGLSFAGWNVVASVLLADQARYPPQPRRGGAEPEPSGQNITPPISCPGAPPIPIRSRTALNCAHWDTRGNHKKHQWSSGMRFIRLLCALAVAAGTPVALEAQEGGGADPTKVAAAKKPVKKKAIKRGPEARQLFGAAKTPAPLAARAIGFYAKGCLAGAAALPIDGAAWQAMRLSRNRNWGHPKLVALVEKLAIEAKEHDGWPGLLVGDLSQPRGGPMLTGHASHQVGLDADIWLTPMPDRRLTEQEREDLSATSMLAADQVSVDPKVWTDAHVRLLKRAASYAGVERIFVHPAIKKALCEAAAKDTERAWTRRSAPIGATTTTSTCASPAPRAAPTARLSRRSPRTTAAAPSSSAGSPW